MWRDGSGSVELPAAANLMFVSQRPYLPAGTLRDALPYPLDAARFSEAAFDRVLLLAGLHRHARKLDQRRRWTALLSPASSNACISPA